MKRILVALDTSAASISILRAAVRLARAIDAKIHLFRVIEGAAESNSPNKVLVAQAEADLDRLGREDPSGIVLGCHATMSETPWRAICDAAQAEAADLIVIGAHEHGAIARALGTNAANIVNHAYCSVLVVRGSRPGRPNPGST